MSRLKKAEVNALKALIEKFHHNTGSMCFNDFRKAFVNVYKDMIPEFPDMEAELIDFDNESGIAIENLARIYSSLEYDLNNMDDKDEIEEELSDVYLDDFWTSMKTHYKKY